MVYCSLVGAQVGLPYKDQHTNQLEAEGLECTYRRSAIKKTYLSSSTAVQLKQVTNKTNIALNNNLSSEYGHLHLDRYPTLTH